jgi:hypothetical protein
MTDAYETWLEAEIARCDAGLEHARKQWWNDVMIANREAGVALRRALRKYRELRR